MTNHQQLIRLLAQRSVRQGQFKLASGKESTLYIDARMTTMSPEGQALIGPLAIEAMRTQKWKVDSVGGLTLGADPIAYSISYASNLFPPLLRAFSIRKEAKTHGIGKMIEGPFRKGDNVVVLEDVITTGVSAMHALDAVQNSGGNISGILALVDRGEGGIQAIKQQGYNVLALIQIEDLTAFASGSNEHPNSADE